MPADREIGFAVEDISVCVKPERYSNVSEMVEVGRWESASTRDSIAATGIVISGSDWRRFW